MRKALVAAAVVFVLMGFARPTYAQGATTGSVLGFETCPQFACGAAFFYGGIQLDDPDLGGQVLGIIQHESVPTPGNTAALTGGALLMQFGATKIVAPLVVGTLHANNDNTFAVSAIFVSTTHVWVFQGTLNHNFLPPLIYGQILSFPIPDLD